MGAALAELEGLLAKALSGPFMDPSQDQRSTEQQLGALDQQFLNILSNFRDLCNAYRTFTGTNHHRLHVYPGMDPLTIRAGTWGLCLL